jgi:hypothetical protein
MPNVPIAGQGTPAPQDQGLFQSFLPNIPAAGQGPAPSATGLTSEMFKYRGPADILAGNGTAGGATDPDAARAAAYARDPSLRGPGGAGGGAADPDAARAAAYARNPGSMGPGGRQELAAIQAGNGQYGAARGQGSGLMAQQTGVGFPINWSNSNNPNVTS